MEKNIFIIFAMLFAFFGISVFFFMVFYFFPSSSVHVLFTEGAPVTDEVLNFIRSSRQYLYISALDVSHPKVISELVNLQNKGIDIRIISEKPALGLPSKVDYSKGLHHAKFMVNENGVVFGSANFTESGLESGLNDVLFFPNSYSDDFRQFFLNMWDNSLVTKLDGFLVSPIDKVEESVVKLLENARKRIWVCVYAFSDVNILAVLKYKASKGVDVRIITDKWFYTGPLNKIPLENSKIVSERMLHHKFIILDNKLITGSTNYTESGFHRNVELIWITSNKRILKQYERIFLLLYSYR
ncbi:MAG: phospholipase D-like domain-containing protein [Fervidobacterium sp.]